MKNTARIVTAVRSWAWLAAIALVTFVFGAIYSNALVHAIAYHLRGAEAELSLQRGSGPVAGLIAVLGGVVVATVASFVAWKVHAILLRKYGVKR